MKKLIAIVLPLFVLVACNPSKNANKISIQNANTNSVVGGLNSSTCTNGASKIGTIYDSSSSATSFEERVKALLSATVAYSDIGQISSGPSDSTGIRFSGVIKLDQNGNVVPAQTSMSIRVYDSYVLNGQGDAIPIDFTSAKGAQIQGQFNLSTGAGYVSFTDNYGVVRFDGKLDAQNFSGTVQFQNSTNVNGGAGASGTLGQFYVARCGIIQ